MNCKLGSFVLLLVVAAGCATQKDVKQVESKVDTLASTTVESKTQISTSLGDVLHKQDTFEKWQKNTEERFKLFMRNQADVKADIDSMDRKMNSLGGTMEEQAHHMKKINERIAQMEERVRDMYVMFMDAGMAQQYRIESMGRGITERLDQMESALDDIHRAVVKKKAGEKKPAAKKAAAKSVPQTAVPAKEIPTQSADELYSSAYKDFLKGDFAAAYREFSEYVKRYPKTDLSDNAQYWAAESLANQGKTAESLNAFDAMAETYPRSTKAATALWRAAELAEKLKDGDKTREFLEKILDNYPTSYEATMVEERLKGMEEKKKPVEEPGNKE